MSKSDETENSTVGENPYSPPQVHLRGTLNDTVAEKEYKHRAV